MDPVQISFDYIAGRLMKRGFSPPRAEQDAQVVITLFKLAVSMRMEADRVAVGEGATIDRRRLIDDVIAASESDAQVNVLARRYRDGDPHAAFLLGCTATELAHRHIEQPLHMMEARRTSQDSPRRRQRHQAKVDARRNVFNKVSKDHPELSELEKIDSAADQCGIKRSTMYAALKGKK
jgi:hypothetical protein